MSPSPVAFLFPGQGSQATGMGKELAALYPIAKQTFQEADDALGFSISQLCFEGPDDQLKLTENTQPAILTMSTAVARVLREKGIVPHFAAGHSLGEYSAHVAAGTLGHLPMPCGQSAIADATCRKPYRQVKAEWRRSWA